MLLGLLIGLVVVAAIAYAAKDWAEGSGYGPKSGEVVEGQRAREREGSGGDIAGLAIDGWFVSGGIVVLLIAVGFYFLAKATGSSKRTSAIAAIAVAAGGLAVMTIAAAAGVAGIALVGIAAVGAVAIGGAFFAGREIAKAMGASQKTADTVGATVAGAVAGAAVGAAVGGPVGAAVGAVVGAVAGFISSWW